MATIDLTTTARVKTLLGIPSDDTTQDAALALLITAVSARIERYLRRGVESVARTETFDVMQHTYQYALAAPPVATLTSVKVSTSYDFAGATAKVSGSDFTLDTASGVIHQLKLWSVGPKVLQVVYTGGLGANTAAITSNYPELADACEKQVAEEHRRRGSMLRSASNVSGSTETSEAVVLIPIVREILSPWRRPAW